MVSGTELPKPTTTGTRTFTCSRSRDVSGRGSGVEHLGVGAANLHGHRQLRRGQREHVRRDGAVGRRRRHQAGAYRVEDDDVADHRGVRWAVVGTVFIEHGGLLGAGAIGGEDAGHGGARREERADHR